VQLIADQLSVARGPRLVVENLSFRVSSGEALQITGPNGAGKTTLIRAVAGFLPRAAGTLRLDGGMADTPLGEHCHYLGHLNGLKAKLSIAENVAFWGGYLGSGSVAADRVDAALDAFGLLPLASVPAGYLSAGQKRRAGLARLLAADRPVWLLDEPTVSLDAASTRVLAQVIDRHVASGGLVLAATHIPLGIGTVRELALAGATA
jgi:heme exporter protein A